MGSSHRASVTLDWYFHWVVLVRAAQAKHAIRVKYHSRTLLLLRGVSYPILASVPDRDCYRRLRRYSQSYRRLPMVSVRPIACTRLACCILHDAQNIYRSCQELKRSIRTATQRPFHQSKARTNKIPQASAEGASARSPPRRFPERDRRERVASEASNRMDTAVKSPRRARSVFLTFLAVGGGRRPPPERAKKWFRVCWPSAVS